MSGGSMDYIYWKVEDTAGIEHDREIADLLRDLADYLHDEEWWKSCDYGPDAYEEARAKFKAKWFGTSREERLVGYVDEEIGRLRDELVGMIGGSR